ncbi:MULTISPECIES: acyl carrier protein [unclassified Paenibacillus]|uniref:acyl carrier protein n=1 Tax=unclassified Paenibacillus TaxID=185978 RepID=UPI001C0FA35A|nr:MULTISPECIES: acyl carrier protein [unclassified Paenibacillus]MBU5440420.1 acyl carrier protein [Paenibacillus sp. MSJ-34]CAH0119659.1 hypothetical protein PAE9249_02164 [Paenibacillus sp. CECT 9249]
MTSMEEEIKRFIREIVADLSHHASLVQGHEDTKSIQSMGIDSVMLIHLIVRLELYFDIVFEDEEMLLENFETVQAISGRIIPKLGGALGDPANKWLDCTLGA